MMFIRVGSVIALLILGACTQSASVPDISFCMTGSGVPGNPSCCHGGSGAPVVPPPPGCGTPNTIENSLGAALEAMDTGQRALGDLQELRGETDGAEINEEVAAATAIDVKDLPQSAPKTDLAERPEGFRPDNDSRGSGGSPRAGNSFGGLPGLNARGTGEKSTQPAGTRQAAIAKNLTENGSTAGFSSASRGGKSGRQGKHLRNGLSRGFSQGSFGSGSASDSKASSVHFGKDGEGNRTLASNDPEDYFSRISILDSLFQVVEKRYREKSNHWMIHDARAAARE